MVKPKFRTRCPCCNQPLANPIALADPSMVKLSCMEQTLFNAVKAQPDGITSWQLRERVFHTDGKGEMYSHRFVATVKANANKKIAPWGMKISATGGQNSVYRLVQV